MVVNAADGLVIVGMLCLTAGLAMWSIPLALVAVGVLLVLVGFWSHWSNSHGDPRPSVPPPADGRDASDA